ncbi:MAG: heme ABC transporter permease [Legionellales bacterium]|nr:heme ABC transporter permease [Legionellales bacterium]
MFTQFLNPKSLYIFLERANPYLVLIALLGLAAGLWGGLALAPADYQQGDAFRIIYIHVPFAIWSLGFYTALAFLSGLYLVWKIKIFPLVAQSLAIPGAAMTFLACLTGAIWGKPMWGTWWIWDARLTSEFLLLFIYLGYITLSSMSYDQDSDYQLSSIYAVVGFINVPIIHFSVHWWNTLHQGPTITRLAKPAISNQMLWPLLVMIISIGLVFALIASYKLRANILLSFKDKKWIKEVLS